MKNKIQVVSQDKLYPNSLQSQLQI